MSVGQRFRAYVNDRLAAVTEEISVLFEKFIVEYEEELRLSNEENRRKQQLLDQILNPRIVLDQGRLQTSPGPGLNQEITETPRIKEEQSIKHEEEPVFVAECSSVCVKREEPSSLQQRNMELREEPQEENIHSEPHLQAEEQTELWSETVNDKEQTELWSETVNDNDWNPLFSCSEAQINTDRDNRVSQSGAERRKTVSNGDASGRRRTVANKKHQCLICQKTFTRKINLEGHMRSHTGEKGYTCNICNKTFVHRSNLYRHRVNHMGKKPYSCSVCGNDFSRKYDRDLHIKSHRMEFLQLLCT